MINPQDPKSLANFYIELSWSYRQEITPIKVQKLIYITNGWALGLYNTPIISGRFTAKKFGPLQLDIYKTFMKYGPFPIQEFTSHWFTTPIIHYDEVDTINLLNEVWKIYRDLEDFQIASLCLGDNSAWQRTIDMFGVDSPIPNSYIKEEYSSKLD